MKLRCFLLRKDLTYTFIMQIFYKIFYKCCGYGVFLHMVKKLDIKKKFKFFLTNFLKTLFVCQMEDFL